MYPFFLPMVYLKTQRIVVIFFKDLQESIFEKTLVSQLGEAEEDSQQGSVIFFFSHAKIFEHWEHIGGFKSEK